MTHSGDNKLPEPLDELILALADQLVELVEVDEVVPDTSWPDSRQTGREAFFFTHVLQSPIIRIVFTGELPYFPSDIFFKFS